MRVSKKTNKIKNKFIFTKVFCMKDTENEIKKIVSGVSQNYTICILYN